MKSSFVNTIHVRKPKQNVFDLSHEKKMSIKMGYLYPVLVQEVIPGDKFRVSTEVLTRMAPMVAPVMHRMDQYIHYFFVPNRLVYDEWQNFITGGESGNEAPAFPVITIQNSVKEKFGKGTLADYMGIPTVNQTTGVVSGREISVNALPFRAYQLIYNEYYRDQNYTDAVPLTRNSTVTAEEQTEITSIRFRCWEKDYFTSALPTAQRGSEVSLPLGGTAEMDVNYSATSKFKHDAVNLAAGDLISDGNGNAYASSAVGDNLRVENLESPQVVEISGINATINDLRRASKIQVWLEKMMRGGSRYIEQILVMFGVISSDARLQRPEYLGGGKTPIVVSEVLNVSEGSAKVGEMMGHGIGVGNTNQFKHTFEEHGFIIGILSQLPKTCYFQGFEKFWFKNDKFMYAWPDLATLGEDEVLKKELYYDYEHDVTPDGGIGYQPRFSDYRFRQSSVHGDFRDNLMHWHMARYFDENITINSSFTKANSVTTRIFNVEDQSTDNVYIQMYHAITAIRSLPVYGTPSL